MMVDRDFAPRINLYQDTCERRYWNGAAVPSFAGPSGIQLVQALLGDLA